MDSKHIRTIIWATVLVFSLCACGNQKKPVEEIPTTPPSVEVIAPVEPIIPPEEPQEPVYPYTNPLTGVGCDVDIAQNRPIAIMLNNLKAALPQAGISQADIIYELPAEGGITRMLALFQSVNEVGDLGTVRSARDYYVSLALGHDALYLHAGGSPQAYDAIRTWGVTAFDCVNGPYEGTLYWRDAQRKKTAGKEHSVMTSGHTILELMPTYQQRTTHKDDFTIGWVFSDEASSGGVPCNQLIVPFSQYKPDGTFTYDATQNKYLVSEYGAAYTDANNGEQVTVRNVLVLYTDISPIRGDDAGRLNIRTTGTGSGLLAKDGTLFEITWKREHRQDTFSFYDVQGNEMPLSVGTSYINILDKSCVATWE